MAIYVCMLYGFVFVLSFRSFGWHGLEGTGLRLRDFSGGGVKLNTPEASGKASRRSTCNEAPCLGGFGLPTDFGALV